MHLLRERADGKADVLSNVEPAAGEVEGPQTREKAVDDLRVEVALVGKGPDVHLRVVLGRRSSPMRPRAAVIVGMEIEENDLRELGNPLADQLFHSPVKVSVSCQGV